MMKTLTKLAGISVVSGLLASQIPYKNMLLNLMSNRPDNVTLSWTLSHIVEYSTTRGHYDGVRPGATCLPEGTNLDAVYLGLQDNPLSLSEHRPTSATIPEDVSLYDPDCLLDLDMSTDFSLERTSLDMLTRIYEMEQGDVVPLKQDRNGSQYTPCAWNYGDCLVSLTGGGDFDADTPIAEMTIPMKDIEAFDGFGNFTLSVGYDEQGRYLSFFDIYDFVPGVGGYFEGKRNFATDVARKLLPKVGEPIHFYKRWYFNDIGVTDTVLEETYQRRTAEVGK